VFNVATGVVTSFRAVAEQVVSLAPRPVAIGSVPRTGPMPHNGYRAFDPSGVQAAFPDFRFTALSEGLAQAQREEQP
jgi:hypothetical protein